MYIRKDDFLNAMEAVAPVAMAEEWDNVGLLIDCGATEYRKILAALELTEAVADEAVQWGADMLLTHHPVMLKGIRRLNSATDESRAILKLIKNGISLFAAHTNFDCATGGTNDFVCGALGLSDVCAVCENGLGRMGTLSCAMNLDDLAASVKRALLLESVRAAGRKDAVIKRVGVCTGSGMSTAREFIAAGADVLITGDARHHETAEAVGRGLCVIDATHYGTERPAVQNLIRGLQAQFDKVQYRLDIKTEVRLSCAETPVFRSF